MGQADSNNNTSSEELKEYALQQTYLVLKKTGGVPDDCQYLKMYSPSKVGLVSTPQKDDSCQNNNEKLENLNNGGVGGEESFQSAHGFHSAREEHTDRTL